MYVDREGKYRDIYFTDVNYQNQRTLWTPLHAACFQEHTEVQIV